MTNAELAYSETATGFMDRFINLFAGLRFSLRTKMMLAFFVAILLLSVMNILLMLEVSRFNRQYDAIITNITTANSINGYIKTSIDSEMWEIVSGKTEFNQGRQYQIIEQANSQIESMMANAGSDKSKIKLDVIRRTMNTLTHYIDKMGQEIEAGSRVAEHEKVLEDIRGVSEVVEESVQDYMLFEVNQAEQRYKETQARFGRLSIAYMVLLPGVIGFSFLAAWVISASIYVPIKKLHNFTTTVTGEDLRALVTNTNSDEITELGISFNLMISQIRDLLDSKTREQENLKKAELRVLQAQINPHFLYNTLDTIVWLAEANKSDQVIEIVGALSNFFRISLSKGKDWIPLRQEIEHVRSYLTIQKMRYQDILDYEIDVDERLLDNSILKLTLQPLVENALYHGIKTKRNGGKIVVTTRRNNQQGLILEVRDDGVGFTPYKLARIREMLTAESSENSMNHGGFGLENVNKRIKLYYGLQYGISIQSQYRSGTMVAVTLPERCEED